MSRVHGFVAAILLLASDASALQVREAHYVMGTILEVTIEASDPESARRTIRESIAVARALDRELTTYDPESPLSRFNRAAGTGEIALPADLFRVLSDSQAFWKATGGRFDPSVSPLLRLWAESVRAGRLPTESEITTARQLVGLGKLRLTAPDRAALERAGMAIDLGGIGKGYAVDRVVDRLRELGVESAFVSFGESSLRAMGSAAGGDGWEVWIRRGRRRLGPIHLRDAALSTSRSLARSRKVNGKRIGDIVDPRTGRPLSTDCLGSVQSPTATASEAWSKALLLDAEASFRAFEREGDMHGFLACPDAVRASPLFADLVRH